MNTSESSPSQRWTIVIVGMVSLAIAMGIGRFAFTPLMPLMLRDGTLDAVTGTEWAAANYVGYLLGALTASWFGRAPQLGIRVGLVGVALATLCVAWVGAPLPWTGALLRASAGVFSAWVMVCVASWCLPELARKHATALGGWIYTGVGLGIALTGVLTWFGGNQLAMWLWVELAVLATVGAVYVLRSLTATAPAAIRQRADTNAHTLHPRRASRRARSGWWFATASLALATSFRLRICPPWRASLSPTRWCSA